MPRCLDFVGLQYISAGLERLILYLTPSVVWLIGWLWHGQRASARQLATLALDYGGIAIVFGREAGVEGPRVALGAALVLASTVSYAVYLIGSGEAVRRVGALRLAGWATSVACGLCIAQWMLLRPVQSLAEVPTPVLWLSLLNGAACTAAPVLMTMMAIERIGAALTARLGMIGLISTIVLGVLVLDEPFTAAMAAGSACVLAAVWLLARVR